jgi:hypothetical protein
VLLGGSGLDYRAVGSSFEYCIATKDVRITFYLNKDSQASIATFKAVNVMRQRYQQAAKDLHSKPQLRD